MTTHTVVSPADWIKARLALLAKEKAFTKLRDELSQARRDLPWERVEKTYTFDGPRGCASLGDLFDSRRQLLVYHFMYGPDDLTPKGRDEDGLPYPMAWLKLHDEYEPRVDLRR